MEHLASVMRQCYYKTCKFLYGFLKSEKLSYLFSWQQKAVLSLH